MYIIELHDLIIMNEYEERKVNNEVEYVSFEEMKEVFDIQRLLLRISTDLSLYFLLHLTKNLL